MSLEEKKLGGSEAHPNDSPACCRGGIKGKVKRGGS